MKGKNSYRLLIVGLLNDRHNQRFVKHLRKQNPTAQIDFLATTVNDDVPEEVKACLSHLYVADERKNIYSFWESISKLKATIRLLKNLQNTNRYDVVNIQNTHYYRYFYMKYLRRMSSTILLTPWGSDVYRINWWQRILSKRMYKQADYVTTADNKFAADVKRIYNLPPEKTVLLDIGSDGIDYISEHIDIVSRDDAKIKLNVPGKYVITCSYNGLRAHRHELIIDAINKIRNRLPKDLVLFFPFTYCANKEYTDSLKLKLQEYSLENVFFEKYLSVEELFLIRRAADMFIHIQPTDANSASLQEYLWCGAKVVNGDWLRYKELEPNGERPYFLVRSLDTLSEDILNAYNSEPFIVPQETIDYIKSYGWNAWIVKWDAFFMSCVKG